MRQSTQKHELEAYAARRHKILYALAKRTMPRMPADPSELVVVTASPNLHHINMGQPLATNVAPYLCTANANFGIVKFNVDLQVT